MVLSWLFGSGKKDKKAAKPAKKAAGKMSAKKAKPKAKPAPPPKPKKKKPIPKTNVTKRFSLENPLGQGSMSKVYRAYDRKLSRTICLKVLDKEKTARFEARFPGMDRPKEGEICVELEHPNIVKTMEWGLSQNGEQFLVMELIEGKGFEFLIACRHEQLLGNRISFLVQATEGLGYLHENGYMHRDICPRNMMVTKDDEVKLIDFGLAIPDTPLFRRPGNRTGTASYMAPELIRRSPTDLRVDLYALGITAYEVFTGRLPWEATQSQEVMARHLNSPPTDPREINPHLDDAVVKFLLKSIERDPRERFSSAEEMRDALKALPNQDY